MPITNTITAARRQKLRAEVLACESVAAFAWYLQMPTRKVAGPSNRGKTYGSVKRHYEPTSEHLFLLGRGERLANAETDTYPVLDGFNCNPFREELARRAA